MFDRNKSLGKADDLLGSILLREETNWSEYQIRVLSEDQKSKMTDKIVTSLFNDIKAKSLDVDFDFVDATQGDVTRLKNYDTIDKAIKFLQKIVLSDSSIAKKAPEMKEATNDLAQAWGTLHKYKKEFQLGFKLNNPVIRYLYNSLVVALIQGTSFTVAESVEFVKDNLNLYKAHVKPSKNIARNNYLKAISGFNELERKGQLVKFFQETQQFKESPMSTVVTIAKNAKDLIGGMSGVSKFLAILGLIGFTLALARAMVFMYYNTRVQMSQYLNHLKDFVQMNASTLGNDAKQVKEKQMKIADNLGKLADKISVDQNVSNDRTNSQIDESNKILAIGNADPTTADNSSSVLDLY